jgi:hypothetical protein
MTTDGLLDELEEATGPTPRAPDTAHPGDRTLDLTASRDATQRWAVLHRALDLGFAFKTNHAVYQRRTDPTTLRDRLVTDLPDTGTSVNDLLDQFTTEVLPWCKNEASPRFMGFTDTGHHRFHALGDLHRPYGHQPATDGFSRVADYPPNRNCQHRIFRDQSPIQVTIAT